MYERIIYETETYQWRVTVNVFRDIEYLHIRKYIMDFDETWIPIKEGVSFPIDLDNVRELFVALLEILSLGIKEGVSFPIDLDNVRELFVALLEILSLGESKQAIALHFSELLENIYQPKAGEEHEDA